MQLKHKKISLLLRLTLVATFLFSNLATIKSFAATNYSDVTENTEFASEIEAVSIRGIFEGNPDGTFKPYNNLNRAELAKILLEKQGISPDPNSNQNCFPDVQNQWFARYVCYAKANGQLQGFPDGFFKPDRPVQLDEAIKMVVVFSGYSVPETVNTNPFPNIGQDQWSAKYFQVAKEKAIITQDLANNPARFVKRNEAAFYIYRDAIIQENNLNSFADFNEPDRTNIYEINDKEIIDPVNLENSLIKEEGEAIKTNLFSNIVLNQEYPTQFYRDEIYLFSGSTSSDENYVTALVNENNSNESEIYIAEIINGKFELPIYFPEPGTYYFGMRLGLNLQEASNAIEINVDENNLEEAEFSETNNVNNNSNQSFNLTVKDNLTYLNFPEINNSDADFVKVTFEQDGKEVEYFNRQKVAEIPVRYRDFRNFDESTINLSAQIGEENFQKTVKPLEHAFSNIREDSITATPPNTLNSNSEINFTVSGKEDIAHTAYVIKPNGYVEEFELTTTAAINDYFGRETIAAGKNATYQYQTEADGVYIVEILNQDGAAILDHPVYVGNGIPLLPDYFDLKDFNAPNIPIRITDNSQNKTLSEQRSTMLALINEVRRDFNLNTLTLDSKLNEFAQSHTDDMEERNYISHINLEGESPLDRKIEFGIKTVVGENLAKEASIEDAFYSLFRSASHRSTLINPDWTKVGVGITKDDNGYHFVAQEFAPNELTESDLNEIEADLLAEINSERADQNLDTLENETKIQQSSEDFQELILEDSNNFNVQILDQVLEENSVNDYQELLPTQLQGYPLEEILSLFMEDSSFLEAKWDSVGINIETNIYGIFNLIYILQAR